MKPINKLFYCNDKFGIDICFQYIFGVMSLIFMILSFKFFENFNIYLLFFIISLCCFIMVWLPVIYYNCYTNLYKRLKTIINLNI